MQKTSPAEKRIINNLAQLREKKVNKIMVPRNKIVAFPYNTKIGQMIDHFHQYYYSRYPVFYKNVDQIVGILYIKDIIPFWPLYKESPAVEFVRLPHFIYENQPSLDVFLELQNFKISLGVVLDEFGATSGLVTTKDLLKTVFGEIENEFDEERKPLIERISNRESILETCISLDDFAKEYNILIDDQDITTVAGLIIKCADRIPKVGEEIIYKNLKFTILSGSKQKIDKVKVIRL